MLMAGGGGDYLPDFIFQNYLKKIVSAPTLYQINKQVLIHTTGFIALKKNKSFYPTLYLILL